MDGLTAQDIAAIEVGADCGGKYLDSIQKTDLATLTEQQWMIFCEAVVMGAVDKYAEMSLADIPFPELKK